MSDYGSINSFTYKGKNSADMGLVINSKENAFGAPSPNVELMEIPGRPPLISDNRTDPDDNEDFGNFDKKYACYLEPSQNLATAAKKIYAWLFQDVAYGRLEDSYEEGYYRKAYCGQSLSVEDVAAGLLGRLDIIMTCQAFKYSLDGEKTLTLTTPENVLNPEKFTAQPYIKIYGSGGITLKVNGKNFEFKEIEGYIEIDSEIMNAYKGDILQNDKMLTRFFPKLRAGNNMIGWTGSVDKVEIIPRWCTL